MSLDFRRALVRRLDVLVLAGLLLTSGTAGVLFAARFYNGEEGTVTPTGPTSTAAIAARAVAPSPAVTPLTLADTYAGQPLTLHGAARPGDVVQLYDRGELIAIAVADESGAWALTLPGGLDEGPHALTVQSVGADGGVSQAVPVAFLVAGLPTATPSPTITASPAPSATFTASPTASPSATDTATLTASPTATLTPTLTATSTASFTPSATATLTPSPTVTPTATVTFSVTPTETASPTLTWTATPSATATLTSTPSATPSATATASHTPTLRPTLTVTPAVVALLATETATASPSSTITPTPSATPSATATLSATPAVTASVTPTQTPSSTSTPSATLSPVPPTDTPTFTVTPSATATLSATPSATSTATSSATPSPVPPTRTPLALRTSPHPSATPASLVGSAGPRIDAPASGEVRSPGMLTVRGVAPPSALVTVRDSESGAVLGVTQAAAAGDWETHIAVAEEGPLVLIAVATAPDGTTRLSSPVTITLAPPVQPASGSALLPDARRAGRLFTTLLGILLLAGGFSAVVAARLLLRLARDLRTRQRPR